MDLVHDTFFFPALILESYARKRLNLLPNRTEYTF